MKNYYWTKEIDATLIVSDANGMVIEMNDKSARVFEKDEKKVGTKLLDCHPAWAKPHVEKLMKERKPSCYTTEAKGQKSFVYHTPWYENGEYAGLVEMIIPIPNEMPHYNRD